MVHSVSAISGPLFGGRDERRKTSVPRTGVISMKRVFLFLATNIAIVLVVLAIVLQLLGIESVLDEQGVNLNLEALLVFSAVFGMGGSFISLAMSKWMAKRTHGRAGDQPSRETTPSSGSSSA